MRLAAIRAGDIVLVNDGLPYHAEVVEKQRGRLRVRPVSRSLAPRTVKAAWVVDHWRHAARRTQPDRGGLP
jgi:hypothetical protein